MRPILTLAAMLAAVLPSNAWAASDWVLAASAQDGTSTVYVDRNSIRRTGAVVRYWRRSDFVNDPNGKTQSIALSEANCTTGQARILQLTQYYSDGRSYGGPGSGPWFYATPDTLSEGLQNFVCGR